MGRILRRRLALTVALAAVLAGGTAVALGATGKAGRSGHARHARVQRAATKGHGGLLQAAAAYLGLDRRQLTEQLRSGKSLAQIAAATPGKTEAGVVAAMVAAVKAKLPSPPPDLETRVRALVNRTPGTELNRHARAAGARHSALRQAVLSYLGLTRRQLLEQLRTGKTIGQVADSIPGKSAAGLSEALVNKLTPKLDAAVKAHRFTKRVEAAKLAALRTRIARVLARSAHPASHAHSHAHPRAQAPRGAHTGPTPPA